MTINMNPHLTEVDPKFPELQVGLSINPKSFLDVLGLQLYNHDLKPYKQLASNPAHL